MPSKQIGGRDGTARWLTLNIGWTQWKINLLNQLASFSLLGCLVSGTGGILLLFKGFRRRDQGARSSEFLLEPW